MAKVRIPHLRDNYFAVSSAISSFIAIQDTIHKIQSDVVARLVSTDVYDDDPEINSSIRNQLQFYMEDEVARAGSNAYILLVCSGVEEAVQFLIADGIEQKTKKEKYGDYFKRLDIVPTMSNELVIALNDIFTLRHWIVHRNGSIRIQRLSIDENEALARADDNIEIDLRHIIIKHEYVNEMALKIDAFFKQVAKTKYEPSK
jgi:hypothetical protein